MSLTFTLLRHGRSRADDEEVHEGRYDSPLTEVGRTQALALATRWQREGASFDRIVASSLCRAAETAAIVGAALGLQPELIADLMERDNGTAAGLSYEEVERRYPSHEPVSPYTPLYGNGESEAEFHRRVGSVLEWLVRSELRAEPRAVLVVAHGGILNAILRNAVGAPLPLAGGPYFAFGDTGFARLHYEPERHGFSVLSINDTRHLEDLP